MTSVERELPLNVMHKLCGPDDKVWTTGGRPSWRYFDVSGRQSVEGIGMVRLGGANFVIHGRERFLVLEHSGLSLQTGEDLEGRHDLFAVTLERPIVNDSLPLPHCTMTIDGHEITFQAQMLHGNPDLPEESDDFIESWHIVPSESDTEIRLVTPADPKILSLLNFGFKLP